ncbi:hypothetical protein BD779DRAFT_1472105 [Infundibulicybe gibba]|nr:hypothetical protein BD779DRAFT_1472105 [Infundibulicybe gibba]
MTQSTQHMLAGDPEEPGIISRGKAWGILPQGPSHHMLDERPTSVQRHAATDFASVCLTAFQYPYFRNCICSLPNYATDPAHFMHEIASCHMELEELLVDVQNPRSKLNCPAFGICSKISKKAGVRWVPVDYPAGSKHACIILPLYGWPKGVAKTRDWLKGHGILATENLPFVATKDPFYYMLVYLSTMNHCVWYISEDPRIRPSAPSGWKPAVANGGYTESREQNGTLSCSRKGATWWYKGRVHTRDTSKRVRLSRRGIPRSNWGGETV